MLAEDVVIRAETPPGDVAQVDFGYAGKLYDPKEGRFRDDRHEVTSAELARITPGGP